MKIFSSFDTGLSKRQHNEAIEEYGEEDVLLVHRSPIYLLLRVYNPLAWWVIASILLLWWMYTTGIWWLITMWWILVIISGLYIFWRIMSKLIDYYMDFALITPKQITAYDQWWLLDRSIRALDIMKIKSINIRKNWLLDSIFNYGSIVFFSEGDPSGGHHPTGDIELNYMAHPTRLKNKISAIIDKYQNLHGN